MADRESQILARIASGVADVDPGSWDRLAGPHPFVSHAFLSALEREAGATLSISTTN